MCCDSFVLFIWTRVGRQTFNALSSSTSEISIDSEKMHIPMWTLSMASSMQAALYMDPNYAKNLEIFKNSEFENIESLFNVMNMMIARNSEIKNLFPEESANPSWERSTLPIDQAKRVDESKSTRVLGSSAMHVKNARFRRCSQKMERTRVNLTDVPSFQRITMESRLHSSGRFSQEAQLRNFSKKFKKTLKDNASDLKVSVIE